MSKKYDIYGIGNALVDVEYEVNDDFFTKNNFEKGIMTLIDKEKLDDLYSLSNLKSEKYASGGSAANTLITAAHLGAKGFYSCKVAADSFGDIFLEDLSKTGLSCNLKNISRNDGTTGQCMVFVTPDAERTMLTYLGITEHFSVDEINFEELKEAKYLYVEGYLVTSETGREAAIKAIRYAKENNVKVALTLSDPSMPKFFGEGLKEMIGEGVDILFCNEEELTLLADRPDIEASILELQKLAKSIVITRGENGAISVSNDSRFSAKGVEVTPLDTVGAGDTFAGAYLYGITNNYSIEDSLKLGCHCAGELVTRFGPRLEKELVSKIKNEVLD